MYPYGLGGFLVTTTSCDDGPFLTTRTVAAPISTAAPATQGAGCSSQKLDMEVHPPNKAQVKSNSFIVPSIVLVI